jgi:NAD(P)-dependent dehydrogenase (short-subunit alcohol dehydrogenase family)
VQNSQGATTREASQASTALVTGTTSGLGYAAAALLAAKGYRQVIVTGRSLARVTESAARLAAETGTGVFVPLELDLNSPTSVRSAVSELAKLGHQIDFLLLNAGLVAGKERVLTAAGIEATQAPLIGHHQLTMGLLHASLLGPSARIAIAGSEAARGDVPLFAYTDVAELAARYGGDRSLAVEAVLRGGSGVKYDPNRAYADAKLIVAWWAAALARRLPSGMAVYAVSPGSAPDTDVTRNAGPAIKWFMLPIIKLIPGMSQTLEVAAGRYLQAAEFGTDVSGQFFASAPKKLTGPIEAMRHLHLHDRVNQEAAWEAVVKVSEVDVAARPVDVI